MISRGALCFVFASCAFAADLRLIEAVEPHMGTLVRIQLYAEDDRQAAAAFRAAFARIAQLDEALSDYRPDSELNRLCAAPGRVSDDLFRVLAGSQKLAEETDGAFDVTLGPVIRLWREARRTHQLPAPIALHTAAARTGFRKLHLDAATHIVKLDLPDMQLDLGAIAKGYAAAEAIATLAAAGTPRALVAISGDIAAGDPPPHTKGWRVAIGDSGEVAALAHAAISTSGDTEQHLDIDGTRYSHIIDPRTLSGLTHPIEVTVISPRGVDADALSTAISVLGADRGLELLLHYPDAAARIATPTGTVESQNWPTSH